MTSTAHCFSSVRSFFHAWGTSRGLCVLSVLLSTLLARNFRLQRPDATKSLNDACFLLSQPSKHAAAKIHRRWWGGWRTGLNLQPQWRHPKMTSTAHCFSSVRSFFHAWGTSRGLCVLSVLLSTLLARNFRLQRPDATKSLNDACFLLSQPSKHAAAKIQIPPKVVVGWRRSATQRRCSSCLLDSTMRYEYANDCTFYTRADMR